MTMLNLIICLIVLTVITFIINSVHSKTSWVSIYFYGIKDIFLFTLFYHSYDSFIKIFLMLLFGFLFFTESVSPIRSRIITEKDAKESKEEFRFNNLTEVIDLINHCQIGEKVNAVNLFPTVVVGAYQPKYMLKVIGYLIGKAFITPNDQGFIINRHISKFTILLLRIGIIPTHGKVGIRFYED